MAKYILLSSLLFLGLFPGLSAFGSELDDESGVINAELSGTVVIRINSQTQEVERVSLDRELASEPLSQNVEGFQLVPVEKVVSELDSDSGQSSWYYYWPRYNNWYYGYYHHYGYWYRPYYSYVYGGYYYYYYNRWHRWF